MSYKVAPGKADCYGNVCTYHVVNGRGEQVETFADNLYEPRQPDAKTRAAACACEMESYEDSLTARELYDRETRG